MTKPLLHTNFRARLIQVCAIALTAAIAHAASLNIDGLLGAMKEGVSAEERQAIVAAAPQELAIPALIEAITTRKGLPTEERLRNAYAALGSMGAKDGSGITRLSDKAQVDLFIKGLKHEDSGVRKIAAETLARVGTEHRMSTIVPLSMAQSDSVSAVAEAAKASVLKISQEMAGSYAEMATQMTNAASANLAASGNAAGSPQAGGASGMQTSAANNAAGNSTSPKSPQQSNEELMKLIQQMGLPANVGDAGASANKGNNASGDSKGNSGQKADKPKSDKFDPGLLAKRASALQKKASAEGDKDPELKKALDDFQGSLKGVGEILSKPDRAGKIMGDLSKKADTLRKAIEKNPNLKEEYQDLVDALGNVDLSKLDFGKLLK